MLQVISCITQEHNYWLLAAATFVCVLGSVVTIRLARRTREVVRRAISVQVALSGIIGGGTIWATHFIGMLAYDPVVERSFEPVLTGLTLFLAVSGFAVAIWTAAFSQLRYAAEIGGAIFGLVIAGMHYVGMVAFLIPGHLVWDSGLLVTSIGLAVIFGIIAFHRAFYPVTKYCWIGASIAMVLAICCMHFTAMGAITIDLDPTVAVPKNPINDATLAVLVLAVMMIVLSMGFAVYTIANQMEQDTHDKLQSQSLTDELTALPNRRAFLAKRSELALQLRKQALKNVALLTLDLDLFKQINNLHGHGAGDIVLREVSDRLENALEPDEFIARLSGDEFIAIKTRYQRVAEVTAFAERLRAQIHDPIYYDYTTLRVGVSIGIASAPENGLELSDIQGFSNLAMHQAKKNNRGGICTYQAGMSDVDNDVSALNSDLRNALAEEQFTLVYQMQNNVADHHPVGFEALLRWRHPIKGAISPADFIPIAEQTGLIRDIGLWVLRTACREAASWKNPLRIAVNVAPQQLVQPSFVEQIADTLMESGLQASRLELEITEASIIDDHNYTLGVIHKIKAMGVRIAMDDFGTGYSSLATLQAFPFDKIKIDRSFVTGVQSDTKMAAIVRATLMIGQALEIPVLAEGAETQSDMDFLQAENCGEVQGYFFGKPMTCDEIQKITMHVPSQNVKAG